MRGVPDPPSRLFDMVTKSVGAKLTRLELDSFEMELPHFMTLLDLGKLSRLTFLRIWIVGLTDKDVERIAAACPLLEKVELFGNGITGVAVKQLCIRTAIKRLQLTVATDISADAIAWARDRGVTVAIVL